MRVIKALINDDMYRDFEKLTAIVGKMSVIAPLWIYCGGPFASDMGVAI